MFILAVLATSTAQKSVLWWAAKHRHHHKYSDTVEDVHSPGLHGFLFSHVGWIFRPKRFRADYSTVQDLAKYPELMWLDKRPYLPAALLRDWYTDNKFGNVSTDVTSIFCTACDKVGLRWTAAFPEDERKAVTIYVSRKNDVARMDEFIGPKS